MGKGRRRRILNGCGTFEENSAQSRKYIFNTAMYTKYIQVYIV